MNKILLAFMLLCIVAFTSMAQQVPILEWQKSLGGNSYDISRSIKQTIDGGYIVAGFTNSTNGIVSGNHGYEDYWVVKLNTNGLVQWQKCLGGSGTDYANSIQQTSDGGYIVAGFSNSIDGDVSGNHGGDDSWVVKLDNSGNLQWQKALGGSSGDRSYSIQQTSDGGYIVAGWSNSIDGDVSGNHGGNDYWVVKLDGGGALQWQKSLGGTVGDLASCVQQTFDGGYIVAGTTNSTGGDISGNHGSFGIDDYWVVKLDGSGNLQWQKCLGGTSDEQLNSIQQTSDGGYIITGIANSNDGDVSVNQGSFDFWTVKLNGSGTLQWQKSYGGIGYDQANSIHQTTDGGYIISGYSESNNGDVTGNNGYEDYWVVKLRVCNISYNTISPNACGSYTLNSQTYTSSGIYTQTLTNAGGCDSILTINLTINPLPSIYVSNTTYTSCAGNNGAASVQPSGGTAPYAVYWNTNPIQSGLTASGLNVGTYIATVTDFNNCSSNVSATINFPPPVSLTPQICMVTVDSASQNNIIYWDKTNYNFTDTFNIYRDISNNNYQRIGAVSYQSLSQFIDTSRTLYAANGNPNVSSWRYKISVTDSCGNESALSPYHQTIFIQNISANFIWNHYQIQGQGVPIPALLNYVVYRDDFSNGNWQPIQTLSASSTAFTDPSFNIFQNIARWRVETDWSISCDPTLRTTVAINTTKSNTKDLSVW